MTIPIANNIRPTKYQIGFINFSGNIGNGWFLLLVTKTKGFKIHIDQNEEIPKTYHFVQIKGGEVEQK